ncbi:uncharacterized protein LOC129321190 [Prosopis cineraria]|uniref:uncharacterized protein LOC129321190 n=1 Tax=Prosopis cineraria TaxID=364024 RepID=UPI00241082DA|nr:uncharacterized protein LOC129321190 [Prosopis cineraria]
MAVQSPCQWWSCARPSHSDPFSLSCSSSSSSSSSSSAYTSSFLHSFQSAYAKRHRLISCSFPRPSSPPPPSSPSNSGLRLSTTDKLDVSGSKRKKLSNTARREVSSGLSSQIESQKRGYLIFKSFFGKRSLWRRILFASNKLRGIILLNVITIVYASNIPIVKEVEAIMSPAAFTVVRFTLSAIPFIPFVLQARGDARIRNAGIELGFWVSLGYLMQAFGLLTSDAGRASFISMFTVIVVPLIDGILGAVIPARIWFGAIMSILGVGMLESSGSPPSVGDLLNFLSAVFFGVHMLRTERISRSISKKDFLPLLGYQICVVALFSTIWYLVGSCFGGFHDSWPSSWSWAILRDLMVTFPWIPALYTGIFSTGLCLWIEMAAMQDVSATETAVIYGLEPVWGAAFAWFLLGERWGTLGWIGASLVLGGSLTVQIFGSASESNRQEHKGSKKGEKVLVSDEKNGFSSASVIVRSREDASDILK